MRVIATVALLVLLADCSGGGGGGYSVDRPLPPSDKPELVCSNTSACLTALPVPTGTTRRGP